MCNYAKTFIRGIFTFFAFSVLIFAAGCGGGSSSPGPNNNGGPTMSGGGGGSAASGFLYLGQPSAKGTVGKVSGFAVSSDGSLQPTPGSPYSGAGLGLAADPAGGFIYGSDFSKVTSYAVANDGALNVGGNLPGTFGPRLTIDNAGHTLYALQFDVGGTGNDDYAFLNIGSDGALQNIGTTGQSVDQFALYVTPDNSRLYQPFCFHLSSDIKGFVRNADGTLTPFNTSVQIPSDSNHAQLCPQSLAVSPDGKFLVATLNSVTTAASSLGVFNINTDGTLTAVAGSPVSTASQAMTLFSIPPAYS